MPQRTQVSFTTFNLYNLHLPGERIYRDSDGWNTQEYNKKIDWTSRVVKRLDCRSSNQSGQ